MKAVITLKNHVYEVNFNAPIDISLPSNVKDSFTAWYVNPISINPVMTEDFIGSVKQGGAVNFCDMHINPHGNTTHTECVGHISKEKERVNDVVKKFHFLSQVISVSPRKIESNKSNWQRKGDYVIDKEAIEKVLIPGVEAVVLRTQKDYMSLFNKQYNNTNWPYLIPEAASFLRSSGVKHLLIDQPSIDREKDGGQLLAHKSFWDYPQKTDLLRTITEFIAVPEKANDGIYLLNLSIANFSNDASPSRPILFKLIKQNNIS